MGTIDVSSIKRVMVTGGAGWIATNLIQQLVAQGVQVVAVCRDPRKGAHLTGAEVAKGDVTEPERLTELARGCDVIFHIAAAFSDSAAVQYRVNVQGTVNVAEAAKAVGVTRLVHVSSVAVYGLGHTGIITEDSPQQPSPRDFYQQSKKIGEDELWKFARKTGLPTSVIRPSFVYGAGSAFWSGTMFDLVRRLPFVPELPGNAHPIYIDDVVEMLLLLAIHPDALGEAFHCTPDPSLSWREYLGGFARIAGRTDWRKFTAASFAPLVRPIELYLQMRGYPYDISGTMRFVSQKATYSMQKARELLNWSPSVSFAEGMAASEEWLLTGRT
jgi:nucleoside-diphosphate-sugar epimerase